MLRVNNNSQTFIPTIGNKPSNNTENPLFKHPDFKFKDFHSLDDIDINTFKFLSNSMDEMEKLPEIESIKEEAIKLMNLLPGNKILEVGCGHSKDAARIAQLVGNNGQVVAVDLSNRMIEEAKKRSRQNNIEYIAINVTNLPYPHYSFSGCHADRLLVSAADYNKLFKDILVYIKPGGIVSFTDVDGISILILPYTKTTKIIVDQIKGCFVNLETGQKLPELFTENKLQNIRIAQYCPIIKDFSIVGKIFNFESIIDQAIRKGKLTKEESEEWQQDMYTATKQGTFSYSVNMYTVTGNTQKVATLKTPTGQTTAYNAAV